MGHVLGIDILTSSGLANHMPDDVLSLASSVKHELQESLLHAGIWIKETKD
jgi:hypothetical protein